MTKMSDECPRCREYAANGSSYCGSCGRALGHSGSRNGAVKNSRRGLSSVILQFACVIVVLIVIVELITLFAKSGDVFSLLKDVELPFFLLVPSPEIVFSIGILGPQIYWILVIIIIFSSAVFAIWKFFVETEKNGGLSEPNASENTAFFWVCVSLCAMLTIHYIIVFILTNMLGVEVTTPDFGSVTEQVFGFANAAVWEEMVTRLLYIGGPIAIISLIMTRKIDSLKCLLGGFGMSRTAVLFIIISSIIFGAAHYSGWDNQAWKVLTATIMGLFFGYVFVRFGLYASILLHFITDFWSSFDWIGLGGIGIILAFLLIGFGFVALYYILKRIIGSKESIAGMPLFKNGLIEDK
ncbi:CAAX amino terminal protease self- immunity [Candidatus Methanoplasma termitum]|uniref:CAAX amino terminal protease self-immunity n=1 Tax=Candidatus Methanoplasma termitum TaxID=1577791 RepID=A0A0A7LFR2_9ARCH|nr:CPBP family glutamic-type intramembrane protease [Candidatus Methanoplasma termitum]AIZ57082.1 CAAX amino terminal protease self- immunity [Candidatus Methanoplasma termitum]